MKFCPKCGKSSKTGELCKECYRILNPSINKFKDIKIKFCVICNSYFYRNKWIKFKNILDVIKKVVKESTKVKEGIIKPLLNLNELKFNPGISEDIVVEIKVDKEIYGIPVHLEFTSCNKCSKQGSQYFEGILQLRNPRKEVIDFIFSEAKKLKSKGFYITNEVKVKNGFDYFVTSQKYVQNLGKKLLDNFGGILKINAQLFSENKQTGKKIYRINVLFEVPSFGKGDIVDVDNKLVLVTNMAKKISGINLKTGKRFSFEYKKVNPEIIQKKKVQVAKVYPNLEVLDPETYQSVKVENVSEKKLKQGEKVEVVEFEGKYWIIE